MMTDMENNLPVLIQALLQPQRYGPAVQVVELVQTHISWVLLAGDFAYKIKKPVKLSFLDFSTLALRQKTCADELRLNRRFAPDLYLDVVGIFNTPQNPCWQAEGAPIEVAVKMRRFEESARLDHVCARGELRAQHLSVLAETLVAFHASAAVARPDSGFGLIEQILQPQLDNFAEIPSDLPDTFLKSRLAALRQWTLAQFEQLAPLLQARLQTGHVRECHGDLHLANMVLINGQVQMYDCIEFNDNLRWIDVASELAFTYVDLLANGQPGLADWLLDEVLSRNGDYESARLLRYYAVYRAMVRAKVAALRWEQTHGDVSEVAVYVALAERLTAPPPPGLMITHGLSGCGKTVATDALLQADGHAATLRLRSDVQRKRLFGIARSGQSRTQVQGGIYHQQAHLQTYTHLREMAAMLLCAGWSVLVDAAFLKLADRQSFRDLASAMGVQFSLLAPQASPEQLRQRILTRSAVGKDESEATLEVLALQMQVLEPLTPEELSSVFIG